MYVDSICMISRPLLCSAGGWLTSWHLVTHFASSAMRRQLRVCKSVRAIASGPSAAVQADTNRKGGRTLKLQDDISLSFTSVDGHCTMVRDSNNF